MGAKNPVLVAQRDKFEKLRDEITEIQTRAVADNRDLTDDELKQVETKSAELRATADQIEQLADIETRSRAVADMAARLLPDDDADQDAGNSAEDGKTGEQTRSAKFHTKDRDPGHYRSVQDGGKNSFFADLYRADAYRDETAMRRLAEHQRAALTTGSNGVGVVPPHWLTSEFETLSYQTRVVANQVRRIDLGDDPRPLTLPKQTAGTTDAVTVQSTENTALADQDTWDSDVDTVTPKPLAGQQKFSRQMLDMGDPAIDQLIYGDLLGVYNSKVEAQVCAALLAGAASNVATIPTDNPDDPADGTSFGESGVAAGAVIDAVTTIYSTRFAAPDLLVVTPQRFGKFRKLRDTAGRPLMPVSSYGPQNADGLATGLLSGEFEGLTVLATTGMGTGTSYPEKFLVIRAQDTILFESNMLRFRYEEVSGPETVKLGIWAYTATAVRQGGRSTRTITVTSQDPAA